MGQGAPREAVGFYTQALELLPPVDRERRWQALLGREEALACWAMQSPARRTSPALLELARSFDDDNYLAEAYLRQAYFGMRAGDRNLIDQASREALAAARRCGNEAIETKALAINALIDLKQGNKTTAVEKIEEALQQARNLGDESVLAFVLYRAAFLLQRIWRFYQV